MGNISITLVHDAFKAQTAFEFKDLPEGLSVVRDYVTKLESKTRCCFQCNVYRVLLRDRIKRSGSFDQNINVYFVMNHSCKFDVSKHSVKNMLRYAMSHSI